MDKNKIIVALSAAVALLVILNVASCINASAQNALRKKEMLQRLSFEEKMSKSLQERTAIADALVAKEKELQDANKSIDPLKKALAQEQMTNLSLKEQLDKLTKQKDDLEGQLKKQLPSGKKGKK